MFSALTPYILQYGIPILIALLRKWGFINAAETLGIELAQKLASLKTYHERKDFPNPPPINPDQPEGTTNTNATSGGYHDRDPTSM